MKKEFKRCTSTTPTRSMKKEKQHLMNEIYKEFEFKGKEETKKESTVPSMAGNR